VAGQQGSAISADVIVLLGHSHVANWNVASLAGFRTINRGRAGDHTGDLIDRFERDVVSNRPRAVVVWSFDNDIMDAQDSELAAATEKAKANLLKLIEMARSRSIEPVLTTEVTIRPAGFYNRVAHTLLPLFGRTPEEARINSRIVEGNRWVREQVRQRRLLLLDIQRALADSSDQRRPEFTSPDGVHLTREAYAVITAQADATLRGLRR
jgi:lysophospholipase L1-like esterase